MLWPADFLIIPQTSWIINLCLLLRDRLSEIRQRDTDTDIHLL
jgi:hypothetical protein